MADHAAHGRDADRDRVRPLLVALAINTAFFVVELAGALVAGSLTLLADAAHMLTDTASLGLALLAVRVAARPADDRRTYGYGRAEVLGALANGVFLVGIVGYVVVDAVGRIGDPRPVDPVVVAGVGLLGLGANLAAAYVLLGHRENLNVRGAFYHLLADAAGSVAAVIVGVTLFFTDLYVLDPLVAVVIAALVLYASVDLLRDSLNILLQGAPRDVDVDEVRALLAGLDGVRDAHDVHVWALTDRTTALSAHLVVAEGTDRDALLERCRAALAREFGVDHATLQVEGGGHEETVDLDCYDPAAGDGG